MKLTLALPLPASPLRPVVLPSCSVPLATLSVTSSGSAAPASASASPTISELPLAALKTSAVSSATVCVPGTPDRDAKLWPALTAPKLLAAEATQL